jgi:peptide deformylase
MATRKIVYIGDDVLRQKARRVREFTPELHELLDDMLETLEQASGVGLAAPQVGISERVLVIRLPDDEEEYGPEAGVLYEIINPEIIKTSREMVSGIEGCLSIPGYVGEVDRHVEIVVRAQDRHGNEIRVKPRDWLARVFQHEIDHLEGILFIDRTEDVWKTGEEPEEIPGTEDAAGEQEEARI